MINRIAQIAVAGICFICLVQALYWPLLMKPGTRLEWWQNYYIAQVGKFLGYPLLMLLSICGPCEGMLQSMSPWIAIILWVAFIYWLAGAILKAFCNSRRRD